MPRKLYTTAGWRIDQETLDLVDRYAESRHISKNASAMELIRRGYAAEREGKSVIYSAIIPIGAARREDRDPSRDGECLYLYWNPSTFQYGKPEWMLVSNAGVEASHFTSYTDAQPSRDELLDYNSEDEADQVLAEAEEIQADIDKLIKGAGQLADIEKMGSGAWDLARKWGWIK